MKYISFCSLFLSLLLSSFAFGQNLVPNPSFEDYLECPYSTAEFQNQVVDWYSWQETPDYFNSCSDDIDGFAGVPDNVLGFQYPLTGNAYGALYTYAYFAPNIREYMAAQLLQPLLVGEDYYISFYTSMYDGGVEIDSWCATNHIGLRFFKDPIYNSNNNILEPDNFAHVDYSEILTDTLNWTHIEGYFIADQTYNWLALGNFFDAENTEIQVLNNEERCFGIYYIENICVATDPAFCDYLLSNDETIAASSISVYPNPTINLISISSEVNPITSIELYDLQGRIIQQKVISNLTEVELNLDYYKSGIYILRVHSNDMIYNEKIILK